MAPNDQDNASRLSEDQAGKLEVFRSTLEAIGTAPDDQSAVESLWVKAQAQFSDLSESLQQSRIEVTPRDEQSYRKANDEARNLMALDVFKVGAPVIDGVSDQDRTKAIRYLGAIAYCGSLSSEETHDLRGASTGSSRASLRDTQKQGREFFSAIDSEKLSPVDKLSLTASTSVEPIASISIEVKNSNMKADVENFVKLTKGAKEELANGGISQNSVDDLKKFVFSHSDRAFMAATLSAGLDEDEAKLAKSSFMTLLKLFKLSPKPSPEFIEKALSGQTISREEIGGVYESHQKASQEKSEQRAADNAVNKRRRSSGATMSAPEETQAATPAQNTRPAQPASAAVETATEQTASPAPAEQETAPAQAKQTVADLEGVGSGNGAQQDADPEGIKSMSEHERTQLMLKIIRGSLDAGKIDGKHKDVFNELAQFSYRDSVCANFARAYKADDSDELGKLFTALKAAQDAKQQEAEKSHSEQPSATGQRDEALDNVKHLINGLRDSHGNLTGTGHVLTEWWGRVQDTSSRANLTAREEKADQASRTADPQVQQFGGTPVGFFQGVSNMVGGVGTAIGRTADYLSRKISRANRPQNAEERLARNTLAFETATHSACAAYEELANTSQRMQETVRSTEAAKQALHTANAEMSEKINLIGHQAAHVLRGLPFSEEQHIPVLNTVQLADKSGDASTLPDALKPVLERYQALTPEEKHDIAASFSAAESTHDKVNSLKKEVGKGRDALASGLTGYAQAIENLDGCSDLSPQQMNHLREEAEGFKDKVVEIENDVRKNGMTESLEVEAEREAALQKAMEKIMRVLEKMLEKIRSMFRSGPSRSGPAPA